METNNQQDNALQAIAVMDGPDLRVTCEPDLESPRLRVFPYKNGSPWCYLVEEDGETRRFHRGRGFTGAADDWWPYEDLMAMVFEGADV